MDMEDKVIIGEVEAPIVETNPDVDKAVAGGWKPQEEWEGNPEDWVDAKQFNKNGEYIDHIKELSSNYKKAQKKLTKLEQDFGVLAEHHSKVREIEYKKAMTDLKTQKREALSSFDADRVMEIDDQIEELKDSQVKSTQQVTNKSQAISEELQEWIDENPWYNKDAVLRGAAHGLIDEMVSQDPSRSDDVQGLLKDVKKTLEKEFPNKLGVRTRSPSGVVESGENIRTTKTSYARRLNSEERKMAQRFVDRGALASIEDYAKQLYELEQMQ